MNSVTSPGSDEETSVQNDKICFTSRPLCNRWFLRCAVIISAVTLMFPGVWRNSVTVVEYAQLPAGLAALQNQAFGIYRVCGPLSKLLYGLPAHLVGIQVSYPDSFNEASDDRREWNLGQLFEKQNLEHYHNIYRFSRLLPILLTILGGCLVCEWSTRLFGTWPGLASLCIWCWLPPILGNGSLITSDMPAAVMMLVSARMFWGFLVRPRPVTALLTGIALGLGQATKFSLLVLDPCWALLIALRYIWYKDSRVLAGQNKYNSFSASLFFLLFIFSVSIITIDIIYGFNGIGFNLLGLQSSHSSLINGIKRLNDSDATAWILHIPIPLPVEFIRGLDFQLADTERLQSAYLFGHNRFGGWWYWYAASLVLKIPLPALALFFRSIKTLPEILSRQSTTSWAAMCILLPTVEIFLLISMTTGTGTNAAFRYLLPSIALICVFAGSAFAVPKLKFSKKSMGLLSWLFLDAVLACPDHLGAQNELAWVYSQFTGRPALIGDSLDWGQDISRLSLWVNRHASEGSTQICVYGLGMGESYGLYPPLALASTGKVPDSAYIAISEQILFGDLEVIHIKIAGVHPVIKRSNLRSISHLSPFDRVGRTIRIYRYRDVMPLIVN